MAFSQRDAAMNTFSPAWRRAAGVLAIMWIGRIFSRLPYLLHGGHVVGFHWLEVSVRLLLYCPQFAIRHQTLT